MPDGKSAPRLRGTAWLVPALVRRRTSRMSMVERRTRHPLRVEAGKPEPFFNAQIRFPVSREAALRDTCGVTKVVDDPAASALLGSEGPFAREVPNFAPRETQQRMADAVADAIDGRDALVDRKSTRL